MTDFVGGLLGIRRDTAALEELRRARASAGNARAVQQREGAESRQRTALAARARGRRGLLQFLDDTPANLSATLGG